MEGFVVNQDLAKFETHIIGCARDGFEEFNLTQPSLFILLDSLDWLAIGLSAFILGGLLPAFILYFRTAFKQGGGKKVRR